MLDYIESATGRLCYDDYTHELSGGQRVTWVDVAVHTMAGLEATSIENKKMGRGSPVAK